MTTSSSWNSITIPTGIVSVEIAKASHREPISTQAWPCCSLDGHHLEALLRRY